jgi:hypothetical protein
MLVVSGKSADESRDVGGMTAAASAGFLTIAALIFCLYYFLALSRHSSTVRYKGRNGPRSIGGNGGALSLVLTCRRSLLLRFWLPLAHLIFTAGCRARLLVIMYGERRQSTNICRTGIRNATVFNTSPMS